MRIVATLRFWVGRLRWLAPKASLGFVIGLTASAAWASGPVLTITPPSLAFGSRLINTTSAVQTATLTNTGNALLFLSPPSASIPYTFRPASNCGTTLAPGASCTINVNFSPVATGVFNGAIQINDDAPGSPHSLLVSGTGVLPVVGLYPKQLTFGAAAKGSTSAAQHMTLTNQGTVPLNVGPVTSGLPDFAETDDCTTLAAGASCTINVIFSPTADGTRQGHLTIANSDPSSPQLVALSGTGTSGRASLTPVSLTFGSLPVWTTSAVQTVTVTNTGGTELNVLAVTASGDYSQTNTCTVTLAAGADCSISVMFRPSEVGSRKGFITVNTNDAASLHTVNLTGTATAIGNKVSVQPRVSSLNTARTQQFTALINGTPTSNVIWSVAGIVGGNPTVGTITPSGQYTPSGAPGARLIKATNKSDSTQFGVARLVLTNYAGTFTSFNDNMRTGRNTNESVLTTGNVNSAQFGKLFSYLVDGYVNAQPLYVPAVNMPGRGAHNVVYVATQHDSVYAFDADNLSSTPLWKASFIDAGAGITTVPWLDATAPAECESMGPELGITATPAIDFSSGTLYVIARTKKESGGTTSYAQWLHALDITNGAERSGSPVVIQPAVPGTGEDSRKSVVAFDPLYHTNRVALLLSNGVVYAGWGSLCDRRPYHGWVAGYDAKTLGQVAAFNTTPDSTTGAVWQAGAGIAADVFGNLYFATGNGTFDVSSGGRDYGDTILKMSTRSGLAVADYFTPYNQATLDRADLDLGGGGVLLLLDQTAGPGGRHLLVQVGKQGAIYLINRDNMGQFNSTGNSQTVQYMPGAVGGIRGALAFYRNQIYAWGNGDYLKAYTLYQGLLSQTAVSVNTLVKSAYPGPIPTVSAFGIGQGIVWAVETDQWGDAGPAILRAYDAANVSRELYDSTQAGTRDQAGQAVRFVVPTVANGKVYLGTATELDVYGLFPN
jgi:hypothetical protein